MMDGWKSSRWVAAVLALGATLLPAPGEAVVTEKQRGAGRFANVRDPSSGVVVPQHGGTAASPAAADELLVMLKEPGPGASALTARVSALQGLLQKHGAESPRPVLRAAPGARALAQEGPARQLRQRLERLVRVRVKGSVQEAAAAFAAHPDVEYAQPNYRFRMAAAANDPYYASSGSWGQAHADMWGARTLDVGRAWDRTRGQGVVVAVIDTGMDVQHEDLAANVWVHPGEVPDNGLDDDGNGFIDDVNGWNFVADNGTPYDAVGHGTHVAGIIAAVGDNGRGIVGVAPRAKVMALKALDDAGWGLDSDLVDAFVYAADMGVDVINASFGAYNDSRALAEAVRYAAGKGVLIVAAAGNEATDTGYASPAGLPEVLTVGALTPERLRAGFSNFGERIDVFAPGEHVLSLLAAGSWFSTLPVPILEGKYVVMGGTSMAAPHVAGVAALVLSQHPGYTAEQVRGLVRSTARDVGAAGWDTLFGYGVVDAGAATAAALPPADLTAWLTSPGPYASDRLSAYNRGRYQVRGSALGAGFARYRLEYAPLAGAQPSGPFKRISESTRPVQDGELGAFDASALPDGEYLLRLTTWSQFGRKSESHRRLVKDSTLVSGFPQFTAATGAPPFGPWAFWGPASLTVADLDGDGQQEVLAMRENTVMAWTPRGTMLPGFPLELPRTPSPFGGYERIPAFSLGDLDGNGDLELVVLVPKSVSPGDSAEQASPLHAWHHDGTPVAGFPSAPFPLVGAPPGAFLRLGSSFMEGQPPMVTDLDGDGRAEIVVEYGSGSWDFPRSVLFVVRGDGTVAPGWPHIINTHTPSPLLFPAVADFDRDGRGDIFLPSNTEQGHTRLSILALDGTVQAERVLPLSHNMSARPMVGDVDGDGTPEVALQLLDATNAQYFVFDRYLQELPGWPVIVPASGMADPHFVNLDGDPALEVLFTTVLYEGDVGTFFLHAHEPDGTGISGYPVLLDRRDFGFIEMVHVPLKGSPAGGLLTFWNDWHDVREGQPWTGLMLMDPRVNALPGWPKRIGMPAVGGGYAVSEPVAGQLDIAAFNSSGQVFLWKESATRGVSSPWAGYQGGPDRAASYARAAWTCREFSASNTEHAAAGRAYTRVSGPAWWRVTTWYATGSDEVLGASGFARPWLMEGRPGHFTKGRCR